MPILVPRVDQSHETSHDQTAPDKVAYRRRDEVVVDPLVDLDVCSIHDAWYYVRHETSRGSHVCQVMMLGIMYGTRQWSRDNVYDAWYHVQIR